MNLDKSDIKILTAHELGCRLDDALEAQTKEQYRLEGSVRALQSAVSSIDGLNKLVDEEMDKGNFDLEQAKNIKRFVLRAHQMVTNLMIQADNNRLSQVGRVAGMALSVEIAKKFKDDEAKRVEMLRQAVAQNKITKDGELKEDAVLDSGRIPGIRPGMTLKERRLAEEAAAKAQAQAPAEETPAEETPSDDSVPTPEAIAAAEELVMPVIKKRGRPRKSA